MCLANCSCCPPNATDCDTCGRTCPDLSPPDREPAFEPAREPNRDADLLLPLDLASNSACKRTCSTRSSVSCATPMPLTSCTNVLKHSPWQISHVIGGNTSLCQVHNTRGVPFKSIGGTTAYDGGSDPRIARQPNDSLQYGLVLNLRVGAAGGDRELTTLQEYPILEALAILGSVTRAFQEPDEIPKSLEFQRASHFFCSPDNTTKQVDAESWTVDITALPYLHALGGRQTNKVGWLVAVAIGFLSAPTLLGAFAVAAVVGPASDTISLSDGKKDDLVESHPIAGLRNDDAKARVALFIPQGRGPIQGSHHTLPRGLRE